MRRYTHPEGGRLPALEQNILKYRAIEMVLVLFYAEELRNYFINFIKAQRLFRETLEKSDETSNSEFSIGEKKIFQRAINYFVKEALLNEIEKEEIKKLVDYRNHIAHRIEYLTGDISRTSFGRDHFRFSREKDPKYNYNALKRLKFYREVLPERTSNYIQMISFSPLIFEAAEKTFERELKRLDHKIKRQLTVRKEKINNLNAKCSINETRIENSFDLRHPYNQHESGRLTKRGTEVCYRLYDAGKPPLVVAHLMGLSLNAANNRHKLWERAGGQRRQKVEICTFHKLKTRRSSS